MKKRLLSGALAFALTLSLLPAGILPTLAAESGSSGEVSYTRAKPEVAIFNAYSSKSTSLYDAAKGTWIQNSSPYIQYNAVKYFWNYDNAGSNGIWGDYDTWASTATWKWRGLAGNATGTAVPFKNTTLYALTQPYGNLKVNLSMTSLNYVHNHSANKVIYTDVKQITRVGQAELVLGGARTYVNGYLTQSDVSSKPRVGDLASDTENLTTLYHGDSYVGNDGYIQFSSPTVDYNLNGTKTCDCAGAYSTNVMVTFVDDRAPVLTGLWLSKDGGKTKVRHIGQREDLQVGVGETLTIIYEYDEPIRFSDDSAAGKENLYIDLRAEGKNPGTYKAKLTKLEGNCLYFEYTNTTTDTQDKILAMEMTSLFAATTIPGVSSGTDIPLYQVYGENRFQPDGKYKADDSTNGISTSTCWITDLAGNPIPKDNASSVCLRIDSKAPTVAEGGVKFELTLNNDDVKAALNKANPSDKDYTDNSDRYLGVGDSLRLTVTMSECLNIPKETKAMATTNIQVTEDCLSSMNSYLGANYKFSRNTEGYLEIPLFSAAVPSQDRATQFYQWFPFDIREGMLLKEGDTQINVTKLVINDGATVADMAGNAYDSDPAKSLPADAHNNAPGLDVTATAVAPIDSGYAKYDTGFRYGVTLSDSGSGFAGINGTFTLHNGTDDTTAYSYQYCVKAALVDSDNNDIMPTDSDWQVAILGQEVSFTQTENVYIYIRPDSDVKYSNLAKCTLTIRTRDFAGNTDSVTLPEGGVDWYIDNLAPTVAVESSSRALKTDGSGNLTVTLTMSDTHGISSWQYGWSVSKDTQPTTWTDGAGSVSGTTGTVSLTETVTAVTAFSKHLWVKATDNSTTKTESEAYYLGLYSYDITPVKYTLTYSPKVQSRATLKLSDLDLDGTVIFMIPDGDNAGQYFVRMYQDDTEDVFAAGWAKYEVAESNGIYTFDFKTGAIGELPSDIRSELYTGELKVTVLSGKSDAVVVDTFSVTAENTAVSRLETAGNDQNHFDSETITLRLVSKNNADYLTGTEITSTADLNNVSNNTTWDGTGDTLLSTLSGVKFNIDVGSDKLGWDYANVDWANSKVIVEKVTLAQNEGSSNSSNQYTQVASVPLTPRVQNQTIALPVQDYESGIYRVRLHIAAVAGKDYDVVFTPFIAADAAKADNDFSLTSAVYELQGDGKYSKAYGVLGNYENENAFCESKRECLSDGIVTLPISGGDGEYLGKAQKYTFTFTSGESQTARTQEIVGSDNTGATGYSSYLGQFYWAIWDTANTGKVVKLQPTDADQKTLTEENLFVFDSGKVTSDNLYLAPDQTHTIAIQKVYANGETSVVKEIQVKPVSQNLDGTTSIDAENGQLVFTPNEASKSANLSAGATVYALAYQTENEDMQGQHNTPGAKHYCYGYGESLLMTLDSNGTWRCDLPEGGAIYRVVTITADGCVNVVGSAGLRQLAPQFSGNLTLTDNGGAYSFDGSSDPIRIDDENPGALALTFAITDTAGVTQSLTLKASDMTEVTSESYDGQTTYEWFPKTANALGLWYVKVRVCEYDTYHYMDICQVKGNYLENSKTLTITATDDCNQSTSLTADLTEKTATAPTVTGELVMKSAGSDESGLKLTFSQAVRPAESWAWVAADGPDGYHTEWLGAFPITKDGTYAIEYYDVYGQLRTQEITLTDVFKVKGAGGMYFPISSDVTFSETEPTANDVTVTVNSDWYFAFNNDSITETTPKTHTMTKYGTVTVNFQNAYTLKIHVTNIVKGAPAAEVRYYVYALGREFSQAELEKYISDNGEGETGSRTLTVEGNVQATYKAKTAVTATSGGTSFLFTPANPTESHTFTFEDALGQNGSVTAKLPDGLILKAPTVQREDEDAPVVSVDVYAKVGGSYTARSSFLGSDTAETISARLAEAGYAQGYSLTVNADDPSGFDITVSQADGVTLTGNIITVTKPVDFTVTVTDRSENQNKTAFTVTAAMLSRFDSTAPTADITVDSTYTGSGKRLTITLSDKDDAGNSTGQAALLSPTGATETSEGSMVYTYVVSQNSNVEFKLSDQAGNTATVYYTVTGIDNSPPVATVYWSPSEGGTYNDTTKRVEGGTLPSTKVNKTVTAVVEFDKPVNGITVYYGDGFVNKVLPNMDGTAKVITDGENGRELVRISASPERVTVTYLDNFSEVNIDATVNNTRSSRTLPAVNIIDMDAPTITESSTKVCRVKDKTTSTYYTAPYEVKVTLTPNETVTSPNYGAIVSDGMGGQQRKTYSATDPLVLTFTKNGNYVVQFVDEAGNLTRHTVKISDIDRTAPELTVSNRTEVNNQVKVAVTVNEACTLTWADGDSTSNDELSTTLTKELTFTKNGSHLITATDAAGNSSSRVVVVGSIDKLAPSISFTSNTIYVLQGTTETDLTAKLKVGYTVWDNKDAESDITVNFDATTVDLNQAKLYTVPYTVKDKAGNETTANRFVQVIGEKTVCAQIDSSLILPNYTAVLTPGEHTLTLKNCDEPYTVKARKGIYSLGQMKYLSGNSLSFDDNGKFTVTGTGYYTLLITTQSRQTIRILLYVEQ